VSRYARWLKEEVALWRADGVVDASTAQRILARYPETAERGWGRIIFSAIGAVLVGLGIILFFAYNWQAIPKFYKLALVIGALLAAHGAGRWFARGSETNRGLIEGLHALGTTLFGAGIWLVAQIYHIDEHYPTAFLVWSLGALALAWAMPSIVQALLALFLIAFWAGVELFHFHVAMHGAPLLVVLGVLPLAWWRRSPALLFWALVVLFVVTAFAAGAVRIEALCALLYLMSAAAFLAGMVARTTSFADAEGPLARIGLLVILGTGYALTFPSVARELAKLDVMPRPELAIYFAAAGAALLAAAIAAGISLARGGLARIDTYRRWRIALIGIGLLLVLGGMASKGGLDGWSIALPFNVIVLGLATLLILEGSTRLRPRLVGAGCLVFALVTVSRYADLFSSLLARGAVFVLLGAALFVVGNFYARRKRASEAQP
jgi:uncharacterized membrane protein